MPYCFFERESGPLVCGEWWLVNAEGLRGLDEYEGVSKGHYRRCEIDIIVDDDVQRAHVYAPSAAFAVTLERSLADQPSIENYTLQMHEAVYSPIAHIDLKQSLYLTESSAASN